MSQPLPGAALDQLFRTARTYNAFTGEVSDETLHQLYELLKFGPTEANTTPARIVFVKSEEAKAKLGPALSEGNYKKTMAAPAVAMAAAPGPSAEASVSNAGGWAVVLAPSLRSVSDWRMRFPLPSRSLFMATS